MHQYKYQRRYGVPFKRSVVAEVESGQYTPLQAAAAYRVTFSSVYRWLRLYGRPIPEMKFMRIPMPTEPDRIKELEREKKALEAALAQANMKIILLESTVEVLEEKYGPGSKKKTVPPFSSEPEAKGSV